MKTQYCYWKIILTRSFGFYYPLLESNFENINWEHLSGNPKAVHLLESNPDKINWHALSSNPNATHLLEQNPHKIVYSGLS
jgi:hypothetical protein